MATLRVRYETIEFGDVDIHVRALRDRQQFLDPDRAAEALGISSASWPMFGIVWASGRVLAGLMAGHDVSGKRILELGCGIGLASLVLNQRGADITATDHHPSAGEFLRRNARLNDGAEIPFVRTGWADAGSAADGALGAFDLIIGSDVLYEHAHAELLAAFVVRHAATRCEVIIVDPGRGHHARFTRAMGAAGFDHRREPAPQHGCPTQAFTGSVVHYAR